MMSIALAAASLAVAAGPAADGAPEHRLTLTAQSSGYVDVQLGRGNTFDLARATFRGGRSYLAVVFTRLGAPRYEDSLVAVRFPIARPGSTAAPVVLGHVQPPHDGGTPMSAGTYRVYVLSDAPATVSFPASKLRRNLTLTAGRRTTPRLRVAAAESRVAPDADGIHRASARHPYVLDGDEMVLYALAATFAPAAASKHGAAVCAVPSDVVCGSGLPGDHTLQAQMTRPDTWDVVGYVPRDLDPKGTYGVFGTCYALQAVPACRVVALDRFVSRAPARIALRLG